MNCKPGDLAYIVKSEFPENVGRVVLVVEGSLFANFWLCRTSGAPLSGITLGGEFRSTTELFVEDANLRPITGPGATDDTETEISRPVAQMVEA